MSRFVVTAVFLLLTAATGKTAVVAVADAVDGATLRDWAEAGYAVLKLAVVGAFSFFVFVREPSRRPSRDPVAFAACATAVAAVVLLQEPPASASTGMLLVGELVTLAACVWLLVAVLALGRCFGVLPEVRGLVTRGPYSVVRHPVYLGELGACVGLVVAAPTPWNVGVAAVFAAAQFVRMRLEERALGSEFPEYASYAARTPRLVPRLVRRPG
jgi:protein-S-isoprenylcysteine O-methyltransferase Ste14